MNLIRYSHKRRQYIVTIKSIKGKRKQFVYSIDRYGKDLAYIIAKKSLIENKRIHDFYIIYDDFTRFYVYSHKYGICAVDIDTEDIDKILPHKISVYKSRYTFYAYTKIGAVHRILFPDLADNIVVDHYDKNGLNNRKSNLRPTTISINNKNCKIREDSTTGIRGVSKEGDKKYRAHWVDFDGYLHSKTFSINKYGDKKAKELAIKCRLDMENKYGYVNIQEGSETTSNVNPLFIAIR